MTATGSRQIQATFPRQEKNSDPEETSTTLLNRIAEGDRHAFSELLQKHSGQAFAVACRIVGNSEDAEEVVQDVFVKIWQKPVAWDQAKRAKFSTWLYRVVINRSVDYLRRRKRQPEFVIIDTRSLQESSAQEDGFQERLEALMQELPERQRTAITLIYQEGLSGKEASEVMGIGVKALESLLSRGKATLRRLTLKKPPSQPSQPSQHISPIKADQIETKE